MYHAGPKTPEGRRRKREFEAVLTIAGDTASAWAARHGTAKSHLSQVINGQRESRSLLDKVDGYIDHARACLRQCLREAA